VVTRDSATSAVSAVFFNYPEGMGLKAIGSADSYEATRSLADIGPNRRIRHAIAGLEPGTAFLVEIVDWEHGNVAEAWYRLGSPINLSREESRHLATVADALLRYTLTVPESGVLDLDIDLTPWAVMSLRQSH
jgi:xylan 1,4-beta-xylosidase